MDAESWGRPRAAGRRVPRAAPFAALVACVLSCGCGDNNTVSPASPTPEPSPQPPATGCARTTVGLTPLTDLGGRSYQGQTGGLYPGGLNTRPGTHDAAGFALSKAIVPLDGAGRPDPSGRYAFISVGMSNTTQEFSAFKPLADADPAKDPHLVIVDGAQGGMTATSWSNPGCACWTTLDSRLTSAGVSPRQVAVAWVKLADSNPTSGWPAHAVTLSSETRTILQALTSRFPNLVLTYLSSRIYAGYATTSLNPEPYAYEGAFAVRWLIEEQLRGAPALNYDPAFGPVAAPWIAWGPYLWADGLTPRSDGLTWACSDLAQDGTHPSAPGQRKVAEMLLSFLRTDRTARQWFLANP